MGGGGGVFFVARFLVVVLRLVFVAVLRRVAIAFTPRQHWLELCGALATGVGHPLGEFFTEGFVGVPVDDPLGDVSDSGVVGVVPD